MKLTKEFVEGFLERYDGDLSEPILDVAGRADPVGSLLEYLNRKDIIEWLQYEFDGLLMHGFHPAQDLELPERKNSELLLAFLEATKAENSRGRRNPMFRCRVSSNFCFLKHVVPETRFHKHAWPWQMRFQPYGRAGQEFRR
jgi:hypothetical protein